MRAVARARFVRVSSRKAGLVLDQIRGKSVGEALATLRFTPRAAARLIEKVLRSAVANAEHNEQVRNLDDLRVVHAVADGGPSMKRVQPRAMGRAFFIHHRTSHLTIAVSDETNGTGGISRRAERRAARQVHRPAPPSQARAAAPAKSDAKATAKPAKPAAPRRGRGTAASAKKASAKKASGKTAPKEKD